MSTLINQNDPGMAGLETESFHNVPLQTGDAPVVTTPEIVADAVVATEDLPAYTVVGKDSAGKLIKAVKGTTPAIGFTGSTVLAGSVAKNVAVYRAGMFNPNALNWDASYVTAEDKRTAFEATQDTLFMRTPGYPQS